MEEQKNERTKENQEKKKLWETLPARSCMLMCLAGVYLLYVGYRLCKNVLDGVEGAGIGFLAAGGAFLIVAMGMLYTGIRGVMYDNKRQKEEAALAAAQSQMAETEAPTEEETEASEEKKNMSIKDRANLAGRIAQEEAEEE